MVAMLGMSRAISTVQTRPLQSLPRIYGLSVTFDDRSSGGRAYMGTVFASAWRMRLRLGKVIKATGRGAVMESQEYPNRDHRYGVQFPERLRVARAW
jgi:hypothetical protein